MKVKFLLVFILSLGFYSNVFSNIYYVNISDGDATTAGSLKKAISDAASPGRDTIRFAVPGNKINSASWTITVNTPNLFFDGIDTINGKSTLLDLSLTSNANRVDFYGLEFQQTNKHVLIITGNRNLVDSCFFASGGDKKNSIWISNGEFTRIQNSVFTGSNGHAISVENGGEHTIENCSITGVKDVAIIVRGSGENTISNCSISAGKHNGIGLIAPNNIVENCVSFDNDWAGIVCDNWNGGCDNNILRNNEVYGNNKNLGAYNRDQGGIASNGPNTEIYGNTVYDNGANGILINKVNGRPCDNQIVRDNIIGRNSNGDELGNGWNGIFVWGANGVIVQENIVVNNGYGDSHDGTTDMSNRISGIQVEEVNSGIIQNNYIGTDPNKADAGNAFDGITLNKNVTGVNITENIICNNGFKANEKYGDEGGGGLAIKNGSGNNVVISSNFIGIHEDLTEGGNKDYGISAEGATNVTIGGDDILDGNIIGNTKNMRDASLIQQGCGICLVTGATTSNNVFNNQIINNTGPGVFIDQSAKNNIVGAENKGNTISGNELGVLVTSSGATNNTLRYNSFSCNTSGGISLQSGGNEDYGNSGSPKGIIISTDDIRVNFVSGFAPSANAVVDIYAMDTICPLACSDSVNQGMTMVATVSAEGTASSNGLFAWEYDIVSGGNLVKKDSIIVLATEQGAAGSVNTSEFSICHFECDTPKTSQVNSLDFDICPGENAILTANSSGIGPTGYNYEWYLGSVDARNLVHTATDSTYTTDVGGEYFVVISNVLDPVSCVDTSTAGTVIENSNPVLNITPPSISLCSGGTVNINANASGSNLTYAWTPGSKTDSDINVSSGGQYGVTVTNSVTGCDTTGEVTITEYQTPENAAINSDDLSLCPDESARLTANPIDLTGTDGYTYTWYLNSVENEVITSSNDNVFVTENEGNYIVVVSNDASGGDCADTSSEAIVVANDPPSISILTPPELCSNDTIEVEVEVTGPDVNLIYAWNPGDNTTSVIDVHSGDNYSVTVTDTVTGCDSEDEVIVVENLKPDVSMEDVTFCQDDSVLISAGISDMLYEWFPTGQTIESFYIYSSDTLIVKVTNPSTDCFTSDTIQAIQSPEPKPIVVLPADSSMCPAEGDEIEISALVTANLSGVLTWSEGSVDENPIIAEDTIEYWAAFVDSFGCEGSDTMKIFGECIPPDPETPNVITDDSPWKPIGNISIEQVLSGNFTVYNRWGRMVYASDDLLPLWKGINDEGKECSSGVYYWIWEFVDNTYSNRRYNGFVQVLE